MAAIMPPYPHVFNGYQLAEFRWRFFLGISGALLVLGLPFFFRVSGSIADAPNRTSGGLLLVLALVGAIPALGQFLKVRGAIEAVYGAQLGWGWGLGVFLASWLLEGVTAVRLIHASYRLR